jgi:hypothetical protein
MRVIDAYNHSAPAAEAPVEQARVTLTVAAYRVAPLSAQDAVRRAVASQCVWPDDDVSARPC